MTAPETGFQPAGFVAEHARCDAQIGAAAAPPLAIICGSGAVPCAVADVVVRRGRPVVLFALQGWADMRAIAPYRHHVIALGQLGRFFRLAHAEGCRDIVVVGGLVRPSITQMRLDWAALMQIPRVIRSYRGGDDHLLTGVARILESGGFRLVGAHEVAPEITAPLGAFGRHRPCSEVEADIDRGFALLDAMSPFDVGQAVVIAGRRVLAIEAAEGTDVMLERVAMLRDARRINVPRGVGVLVKAPKRRQDRRFDLPSVGPDTIARAAAAGLAGIAIVAGATIVAEPQRFVEAADRAALFVVGCPDPEARA